MNPDELMDQYTRLQRKLSASDGIWQSGRIDRLASALQLVELALQAQRPGLNPGGHAIAARNTLPQPH